MASSSRGWSEASSADLLDPRNARWSGDGIKDNASEGSRKAMWSPYHGTQPGDPDKLDDALVTIAVLERPPTLFVAKSDAVSRERRRRPESGST